MYIYSIYVQFISSDIMYVESEKILVLFCRFCYTTYLLIVFCNIAILLLHFTCILILMDFCKSTISRMTIIYYSLYGRRNRGTEGTCTPSLILPSKIFSGQHVFKLREWAHKMCIFINIVLLASLAEK